MSVEEAYRQVRHTGCVHGSPEEVKAQLADIAAYLGTKDPIELGAALLLEQAGYEHTRVQLRLDLDGGGEASRSPAEVRDPARNRCGQQRSHMSEKDEPTSLTFDTDQAGATIMVGVRAERAHVAAVAEQILIANRVGDADQVEALSSALREQVAGAWDEELEWSAPETTPTYTVIAVYHDEDGGRYATSVQTAEGPEAAEALAQQACREDNGADEDEDLIRIAAVLRGVHEVVA
ncbi:MAG: hypothetical protein JST59_29595 [Actinobacteria bacterium]|nr:hypothetical protein [Actinomycetota bacterium]